MRNITILLRIENLPTQKVGVYEIGSSNVLYKTTLDHEHERDLILHSARVSTDIRLIEGVHNDINVGDLYFPIIRFERRTYRDKLEERLNALPIFITAVLREAMPFLAGRGGGEIRVTYMFSVPWHTLGGIMNILHYFFAPFTMHLPSVLFAQAVSDSEKTYNAIVTTREIGLEASGMNTKYNNMSITVFIARDLLDYGSRWIDQVLKPQLQAVYGVAKEYPHIVTMKVVLCYNPEISSIPDAADNPDLQIITLALEDICNDLSLKTIPLFCLINGKLKPEVSNVNFRSDIHIFHLIGFDREDKDLYNRKFINAIKVLSLQPQFLFLASGGSALPNVLGGKFVYNSSVLQHLHNSFEAYQKEMGILAFWWYTPALWLQQLSKFFYKEVAERLRDKREVCFNAALRVAQQKIIAEVNDPAFQEILDTAKKSIYGDTVINMFDNVLFTLDEGDHPLNPGEKPVLKAYTYANPLLINNYCVRRGCPECS